MKYPVTFAVTFFAMFSVVFAAIYTTDAFLLPGRGVIDGTVIGFVFAACLATVFGSGT